MSFSIYSSEQNFLAQVALPGINPEKIEVFIERDELVVKAFRDTPEGDLLVGELPVARIERRLSLNSSIDTSNIDAQYEDGLLSLTLAKRSKRIDVRIA